MNKPLPYATLFSIGVLCVLGSDAGADDAQGAQRSQPSQGSRSFAAQTGEFFQKHCLDCHGPDAQEGGLSFHDLHAVTPKNAAVWKQIWAQVALHEMPPRDEEQPTSGQRLDLVNRITGELQRALKDQGGFDEHLRPTKANYLDHDLLFGPLPDGLRPTSTPARLWRIHPMEHLTRLSSLINKEPEFDPSRPGLRAHGDFVPPNREGEVKVYYGLDRVIGWVGGTAAYAASITGFPPVLSIDDLHGLRNYAHMYSVNGAEATRIARTAEDILRFMAYGPDAEPYQFADKVSDIDAKYKHESLRGLAQALFYGKSPKRPLTPVYELAQADPPTEDQMQRAVEFLFEALTCRPPQPAETHAYTQLLRQGIEDLGQEQGIILGLTPIFLDQSALFRSELAQGGQPDAHGRVMLQGEELALAINAAFSYLGPDEKLRQALRQGRLQTREDVEREATRILTDPSIRKPRVLQFFREYFDYDRAGGICKDAKALAAAGGNTRGTSHYQAMHDMVASTDRLIELILAEDRDVLHEMLTTDRVVCSVRPDAGYLGEFVGPNAPKPKQPPQETKQPKKKRQPKDAYSRLIRPAQLPKGEGIHVRVARVVKPYRTQRVLTTLPTDQRMGILTHPSWLVSHSDAMDNHAILRGRWIRERLLGDAVPDVPITVDAMLPDEPKSTLRHRMRVTREEYCWRCHRKMDPLGLPFEMYNHLGMYRTEELGKPVDTTGEIIDSGDPTLDGPVKNALELIDRLASSERATQVFVRHAFRFWMGRNETLDDAPVLQAAYMAYRDNDGSMNAMLVSLLTSDAFLYRRVDTP